MMIYFYIWNSMKNTLDVSIINSTKPLSNITALVAFRYDMLLKLWNCSLHNRHHIRLRTETLRDNEKVSALRENIRVSFNSLQKPRGPTNIGNTKLPHDTSWHRKITIHRGGLHYKKGAMFMTVIHAGLETHTNYKHKLMWYFCA